MANPTLADAFQLTRDRLKTMSQAAVSTSAQTFDYVVPQTTIYPYCDFVVMRVSRSKLSSTQQRWVSSWREVIHVAQFLEGYDGQAQEFAQFTVLPTVLQYFETHGTFRTQASDTLVPLLDTANSAVDSSAVEIANNEIQVLLTWNLIFITNFERVC